MGLGEEYGFGRILGRLWVLSEVWKDLKIDFVKFYIFLDSSFIWLYYVKNNSSPTLQKSHKNPQYHPTKTDPNHPPASYALTRQQRSWACTDLPSSPAGRNSSFWLLFLESLVCVFLFCLLLCSFYFYWSTIFLFFIDVLCFLYVFSVHFVSACLTNSFMSM